MRRTGAHGVSILAVTLAIGSGAHLSAQAQQRNLYVSALDSSGAPVQNLAPADIVVREDRVAREILAITRAGDPLQIALLVDNSQAAEPYIREYRDALPAFINDVLAGESGGKHQISIITLADRPTVNTDYSSNAAELVKGAQRIFSFTNSGAVLLDAILETLTGFRKREAPRPVIVAILTEGPDLSNRHYEEVLKALRESGVTFHVVVVGRPNSGSQDRVLVLSGGTRDTGGRYDNILAASALTGRMKQVAAELTHQYKVTYARPQALIPPEKITVTAAKAGITVRGTPVKNEQEQGRP
jgi:hypothetical protein